MDVRLRPSLVSAKRSQAQAVDVNGPGGGAPEGLKSIPGAGRADVHRSQSLSHRSRIGRSLPR